MKIGKTSSRTKLIDAYSNAWYSLLLLTVLADAGGEDGGVLRLLGLGLILGRWLLAFVRALVTTEKA